MFAALAIIWLHCFTRYINGTSKSFAWIACYVMNLIYHHQDCHRYMVNKLWISPAAPHDINFYSASISWNHHPQAGEWTTGSQNNMTGADRPPARQFLVLLLIMPANTGSAVRSVDRMTKYKHKYIHVYEYVFKYIYHYYSYSIPI